MKVLGHQDITHHPEFQFAAQRIKGGDKMAAKAVGIKQASPSLGAGGDEMQVVKPIIVTLAWHAGILPQGSVIAHIPTQAVGMYAPPGTPERHDGLRSDEIDGPDRLVTSRATTCACSRRESLREPDAGNPHVRFDEGRGATFASSPTLPPPAGNRGSSPPGSSW